MYHWDNDKALEKTHIVMMVMMMILRMMMTRTTFGSESDCPAYQPRVMSIFQL
jgi:hypothetical protein